jgi:uncharacterized protein involved in exopolysaccharide biosynthesis
VPLGPPSLSVRDVTNILFLRRWLILSVFTGVVGAAVFLLYYFLSPTYEARLTMIVDTSDLIVPLVDAPPISDLDKLTSFQTQKDILTSVALATAVVDGMRLDRRRVIGRPERFRLWLRDQRRRLGEALHIQSWTRPFDPRVAAIDAVQKNLSVTSRTESKAFQLAYRAKDGREAAETLNALTDQYKTYFYGRIRRRAEGLTRYLEEQIAQSERMLAESEQALLAFKQQDRLEHEALVLPMRAGARKPAGPAEERSLAGITDSPTAQNELRVYVMSMEEELRKLSAQYAPNNPALVGLRQKLDSYVSVLNDLPRRELDLLRLRRAMEVNQDMFLFLQKNLERARMVQATNVSAINLVTTLQPARTATDPIAPKKRITTVLAIVFGVVLATMCGLLAEFLDHTLRSVRDIEQHLGLRTLTSIPRL